METPSRSSPSHETRDADGPAESLSVLADSDSPHYVEIELTGGLRISGDLRSLKVFPHPPERPES